MYSFLSCSFTRSIFYVTACWLVTMMGCSSPRNCAYGRARKSVCRSSVPLWWNIIINLCLLYVDPAGNIVNCIRFDRCDLRECGCYTFWCLFDCFVVSFVPFPKKYALWHQILQIMLIPERYASRCTNRNCTRTNKIHETCRLSAIWKEMEVRLKYSAKLSLQDMCTILMMFFFTSARKKNSLDT